MKVQSIINIIEEFKKKVMSTLQTQYQNYLKENPESAFTFEEWSNWQFSNIELPPPHNGLRPLDEHAEKLSDWDVTLMDGLKNEPPYVSDDFQIGPDGAYEHTEEVHIIQTQKELIDLLYSQVIDLSMMSKIELGDDVIAEIKRLQDLLKEDENKDLPYQKDWIFDNKDAEVSLPGAELSDIENLKYFFEKYKFTVERGRPNLRAANLLKTYIDTIQVKEAINEQHR